MLLLTLNFSKETDFPSCKQFFCYFNFQCWIYANMLQLLPTIHFASFRGGTQHLLSYHGDACIPEGINVMPENEQWPTVSNPDLLYVLAVAADHQTKKRQCKTFTMHESFVLPVPSLVTFVSLWHFQTRTLLAQVQRDKGIWMLGNVVAFRFLLCKRLSRWTNIFTLKNNWSSISCTVFSGL